MVKANICDDGGLQFVPFDESLPYIEITEEEHEAILNGFIVYKDGKLIDISEQAELENLRNLRNEECFPIINRGKLWYDNLTDAQVQELNKWYNDWLNVTETNIIPEKPEWL